jgi:hypothetical protein
MIMTKRNATRSAGMATACPCEHEAEPQRGSPMNSRGFQPPERTCNGILPRRGRPMLDASIDPALANPSGVHALLSAFRGFRSFLAPPPAIHRGTALRFIVVLSSFGVITSSHAALRVYPEKITLDSSAARQSIVVQQITADGLTLDVTTSASLKLPADSPASYDAGTFTLAPVGEGELAIEVTAGGESVSLPVTVKNAATARPVSFRLDVEPVFMRAGCNSGSCHGSARGQDGFRLSLFGYDPAGDHFRITREYIGRRVDLAMPEQSLMLEKATGVVTHTGGEALKKDSAYYNTLRDWIAAGAPDDPEGTPHATGIRVLPEKIVLRAVARASSPQSTEPTRGLEARATTSHRIVVLADYSDGSVRDITSLALYLTNNEGTLAAGKDGSVTARASGGAWIFARFDKFTAGSEVIVLPERQDLQWPENVQPANYIDEAVFARLRQLQIPPSPHASDAAFLRRVRLDLTALPSSEEELKAFQEDDSPDKRAKLIDKLLASDEFTDLWTMKWAEILQIRANNQNNADNGRPRKAAFRYHQWLRAQIAANRPFNEIVSDLIRGEGSNLANPTANYYTTAFGQPRKPMERAEDAAQLFLGTRIQCAQCHNHPFDRWTMDDYYGFTAFFSGVSSKRGAMPTEIYIFSNNERTTAEHPVDGRQVPPKFLGGDAPALEGKDPRHFLAGWLTSPDNRMFARNMANRAWAHFFGRGIIEPVDDGRISNPPSNEALLAALAQRLSDSKFDVRALARDICNSTTYQLSSSTAPGNEKDDRYFSHSMVRRLQAEVLADTIGAVTGAPATFNGQPQGTRAVQIFDGGAERDYFLRSFGASKRETVCACEVRMEPTLAQTLHLINGTTTEQALQRSPVLTKLMNEAPSPEEGVKALYRRALSREPTGYELSRFAERAKERDLQDKKQVRRFYEDVLWALLNSTEFAFNH